jgi:hypothetical protein
MYTRDPYDIPQPRQPQPETPAHIRAFWEQVPDMRPNTPREAPATFNTCRFDTANKRVYHIRGGCPHFPGES